MRQRRLVRFAASPPQVLKLNPSFLLENRMTEVKSEITLKFNEFPEAKPAANKKVEISLTDQNGVAQ
jgi:hypothetical protein